jgi:DNA-binding transcriptional regulator YdaS (Cro superfamily)
MNNNNNMTIQMAATRAIATYPSVVAMAADLGVHRMTIYHWKKHGVPIKHCPKVEKLTGVPREQLQPKFFGMVA